MGEREDIETLGHWVQERGLWRHRGHEVTDDRDMVVQESGEIGIQEPGLWRHRGHEVTDDRDMVVQESGEIGI